MMPSVTVHLIEGVLYIIFIDSHVIVALEYGCAHWHRLVQNIGGKRKCWGDGVARTDETIGVSQVFGSTCPSCPQVYTYGCVLFERTWSLDKERIQLPGTCVDDEILCFLLY